MTTKSEPALVPAEKKAEVKKGFPKATVATTSSTKKPSAPAPSTVVEESSEYETETDEEGNFYFECHCEIHIVLLVLVLLVLLVVPVLLLNELVSTKQRAPLTLSPMSMSVHSPLQREKRAARIRKMFTVTRFLGEYEDETEDEEEEVEKKEEPVKTLVGEMQKKKDEEITKDEPSSSKVGF